MNRDSFDKHCDKFIVSITDEMRKKGKDYSGDDDILNNFKRNADALGVSKYTILAVYMNKHLDAVNKFMKDPNDSTSEPILGRIGDAINYLLLLSAMIKEDEEQELKDLPLN